MKFNFTPDPKVLLALTHTPMQPLDALCELIDNAIDSFYIAKIQGVSIENPMVIITLPTRGDLKSNTGLIRVQDNGPGMTAENAERAIRAGFSGNNPYDTLGLFGMGFNISTGKLGNKTVFRTSRSDMSDFVETTIDLSEINNSKNYFLPASSILKGNGKPFKQGSHGTIIEVMDWWPEGNANHGFVQKLIRYGLTKIREEIGRRYATILRAGEIKIYINEGKCEPFEHCVWADERFVTKNNEKIPAVIRFDQTLKSTKRCGRCTAILNSDDTKCPSCGSTSIRTIDEKVTGWIGIQRFDSLTDYGIDLIRNGRAIKTGEKNAFFEYVDDLKHTIKDYPIDSQYGRIVGEIHLDFVPVDFLKQDFQRSSAEWQSAMEFIRGKSSLQPSKEGASENNSPMFKLYQGYRRVRKFGRGDMYMGYWDADSRSAKRISREIEEEYFKKFKQKEPGFYDDAEWWKLVESADTPPVEELPECPDCGAQNLSEAETCVVCGRILKGKNCLNKECGMLIELSAKSCPHCGASQIPIILEPWKCKVCGKNNIATDEVCQQCGCKRGASHPLDENKLIATSVKIDDLSSDGMSITLADGSKSNPLKVDVYSTQKPLNIPMTNTTVPLIIYKQLGHLKIFIDLAHPIFTNCGLSKEQLIASEIGLQIYYEHLALATKQEHSLSNLTWKILQSNWKENIEINYESIFDEAQSLMSDIVLKIYENSGTKLKEYFDDLNEEQKTELTQNMIQHGVDLSNIGSMKKSGEYLLYTPFNFLNNLIQEEPDMFFGGNVWKEELPKGNEDLLGQGAISSARKRIIAHYKSCLQDVILFLENKYLDKITLQRIRLSIEFLRKDLTE